MPRLIAFIVCIAFLVGTGFPVPWGMVIAALAVLATGCYIVWLLWGLWVRR